MLNLSNKCNLQNSNKRNKLLRTLATLVVEHLQFAGEESRGLSSISRIEEYICSTSLPVTNERLRHLKSRRQ